ncbi:hypothetical protein ABH920_008532 [Catenulispora sp. EB89]|uniref:hypothetical protein n=1 Tax=Catenulispora sp. EB89 TaxID=3156257 RepID=UPI003514B9DF
MSVQSRIVAAICVTGLAAAPLALAAPAHAALIDEAEVQITFFDAAGHQTGFDDLTLLGAGDTVTVTPPATSASVTITNDPFPLSDAPIEVTLPATSASVATTRAAADGTNTFVDEGSTASFTVLASAQLEGLTIKLR